MDILIKTYYENDHWVAELQGGWWIAHSSTKEKAIKKAINQMEKELNVKISIIKKQPESIRQLRLFL